MTRPQSETPLILSYEEICAITGKVRYRAQARALAKLGISSRLRPDGFPVVSRAHFEQTLGASSSRPTERTEPNWSALDAA